MGGITAVAGHKLRQTELTKNCGDDDEDADAAADADELQDITSGTKKIAQVT